MIEAERIKYQRMWTEVPGYRTNSPGERLVDTFLSLAQWDKGDWLIDCGSGTGRAAKKLSDAGLNVTMLDITPTATDPDVKLSFIEACLWDMPEFPQRGLYDWVYCCDVCEHLPTEHVDAVLDNLATMTGYGAFLQIAMWPENYGKQIGETLHLTVKPTEWWMEKINKRWEVKRQLDSGDGRLIVLTGEAI
jgi:2-polyprenyl-3-methyl-5-hydroxy-6-metoxy-1,4-benzoquinol methylase